MTNVIKRNGKTESFDEEKIRRSINKAVIDAGRSPEEMKKIVEKASRSTVELLRSKKEIKTNEIRSKVLAGLDQDAPAVSDAWRNFDRKYKNGHSKDIPSIV